MADQPDKRRRESKPPSADPPVSAFESGTVRATIAGRIFNRGRLVEFLAARGHDPAGDGDAELVALLYGECGDELVHAIDGEFALAVEDQTAGTVLQARDHFGCVPGDGLPPGSRVLRREGEVADLQRYWCLPTRSDPGGESDAELVAELNRLLSASVLARLDGSGPVGLSEGDGAATALVRALARGRGGRAVESQAPSGSATAPGGIVLGTAGAAELFGVAEVEPNPGPTDVRSPFLNVAVAEFAVTVPERLRGTGRGSLLALAMEAVDGT